MLGGGGGVLGLLSVRPHFCWGGGGGGSKRSAPLFPGPQGEPAHGLHPRFMVAEIWADRVLGGEGGGAPRGLVHNLLMQFFTPGGSTTEVFETCFFDIVTTQYDDPSYGKHVLGRIYMVFTLFGY